MGKANLGAGGSGNAGLQSGGGPIAPCEGTSATTAGERKVDGGWQETPSLEGLLELNSDHLGTQFVFRQAHQGG